MFAFCAALAEAVRGLRARERFSGRFAQHPGVRGLGPFLRPFFASLFVPFFRGTGPEVKAAQRSAFSRPIQRVAIQPVRVRAARRRSTRLPPQNLGGGLAS